MLKRFLLLVLFVGNVLNVSSRTNDDIINLSHFGSQIFGIPIENDGKSFSKNGNPEEQGPYLEGDLLIPTSDKNGVTAQSLRWENGVVPYLIRGSFSEYSSLVRSIFIHATCLNI